MNTNVKTVHELERHSHDIVERACTKLLAEHAEIGNRFGDDARIIWTDHLHQRLLELSSALSADDPNLFTARLAWSRAAMRARGISADDLDSCMDTLRSVIAEHLEDESGTQVLSCIDQAINSLATQAKPLEPFLDPGIEFDRLALRYVQTVVAGNVLPGMQLVMDAVAHGVSVADAFIRVLLPAQKEVGRLWHLNELSVSEEHLVSQTTQRLMTALANQAERKPDNGLTAIAGAVAGNIHDIGIRAIAYLLELDGWRTLYLGSDIPKVELPNTVDTYKADVLLLSVALTTQLQATSRAIELVRRQSEYPVKILVGGNALTESPELWREVGADGYAADAEAALTKALELANRD